MTGGSPHLVRSLVQMDNPDHFELPAPDPGLVPAAEPARPRGPHPRDRPQLRRPHGRQGRPLRLRPRRGLPLSAARDHGGPRRAGGRRAAHAQADPGTVRQRRSGAEPQPARPSPTPTQGLANIQATVMDFMTYFNAMTEDRRPNPRNDLASVIANGQIDGKPLGHLEAMSYYIIVATAGHDTTSNTTVRRHVGPGREPGPVRQAEGRPVADPGPGRGVDPLENAGEALHAHGHRRHRGRRPEDRQGRLADAELPLRQPRRGGVRGPVHASTSTARPTSTWPSATAPTSASASTWPGWRCASSGKSCCRAWSRVELDGQPTRTAASFVCGPKSVPIRYQDELRREKPGAGAATCGAIAPDKPRADAILRTHGANRPPGALAPARPPCRQGEP